MSNRFSNWLRTRLGTGARRGAAPENPAPVEGAPGDDGAPRLEGAADDPSSVETEPARIASLHLEDSCDDVTGDFPSPARPERPDGAGGADTSEDSTSVLIRQCAALERYSDNGEVGRGGMGRVHRVLDKTLLREVALKILRPELEGQERQTQRFMREAQITSQLDHPNIVPIHELGRDDETGYYISMKLVHGKTLTEAIEEAGDQRLVADRLVELLQVFIKVCEAMAFAHSRGVIHRDLKPSNIMVGEYGQVYVMDWGVARLLAVEEPPPRYAGVSSDLERSLDEQPGNIIGTPRYMPPEQIQGLHDQVDERSDIFALGATLYHILTGQPPYTAQSYYNTLLEALSGKIRRPEEVVGQSRVPPGLSQVAMRAMAFKPEDRYASVVDLQKDLERFLRGSWDQVIETFEPGSRIVTEGEEGDVGYIILEGRCRVFTMAGEKKVVLRELGPGENFGETAVFAAAVRTASVEALDQVTVKVVSRETLTDGLGLNSWMGTFVKALAERFRDVDERLRRLELDTPGPDREI